MKRSDSLPDPKNDPGNNLLHNVDLHSLVAALFLTISLPSKGRTDTTGKFVVPKRPTSEIHRKFFRAYSIFDSWPINFRRFIDELSVGNKQSKSRMNPLPGAVGRLYERLHNQKYLPLQIRKILLKEFENHILDRWDRSYLVMSPWFKPRLDDVYVNRVEAGRTLKLDARSVDALIAEGTLRVLTKKSR